MDQERANDKREIKRQHTTDLRIHTTCVSDDESTESKQAGSPLNDSIYKAILNDAEKELSPYKYKSANDILKATSWPMWLVRRFVRCLLLQSVPIYLPIHTLPILLFKRKQLMEKPLETLWTLFKANARSCMFLSSFQTFFIVVICCGNVIFKNDSPYTAALSGLAAPLGVLFENANRRKEMMLYCIPRVAEIFEKYGAESGWFTDINNYVLVLFAFASGLLMYYYHLDSKYIKPSIRSLMSLVFGY